MKLSTALAIAVAGEFLLSAQVYETGHTIAIYLTNRSSAPQRITSNAQDIASKMFKDLGVHLNWQIGTPSAYTIETTRPLVLTITDHTPEDFRRGELASSLPFEGVHIRILYDRLVEGALGNTSSIVLAHVMAHEIGHALQRTDRHSTTGIMKARWKHEDYLAMQDGALDFQPIDVQLIHNGLANRAVRLAQEAVTMVSSSPPK
jgi:hypothetical protein